MSVGVGLELAPAAIRAVVLERSASSAASATDATSLKLVEAREVPCDTSHPDALTQGLSQLRRTLHLSRPITLGVPSTSAILTTVHPLIANPQRALLAVQFELQQQLPFALSDVAWHYHWLSSTNGVAVRRRSGLLASGSGQIPSAPPARLSPLPGQASPPGPPITIAGAGQPRATSSQPVSGAVVAAMRRSLLDERLACCRRAGLDVRAVAINPVALLNVCQLAPSRQGIGVFALLHLVSAQLAEWIVWSPEFLQVVPVAQTSPELFRQELASAWEAFRSQGVALPQTVWVVGSSSDLQQVQLLATESLSTRLMPIDLAEVVKGGSAGVEAPERFMTSLGLALQGLGRARVPLNLLAQGQSEGNTRLMKQGLFMASGLCAVAAVGFGVSGMLEISQRRGRILQTLERQERLYQTLRPEVRTLLQQQQHLERRSAQLAQLVTESPAITQWLIQVAEALPDTVWLTKVECTNNHGVEMLLEGRARSFQDVTQLKERLQALHGVTSFKPIATNVVNDEVNGKELIAFSVQVQWSFKPSP